MSRVMIGYRIFFNIGWEGVSIRKWRSTFSISCLLKPLLPISCIIASKSIIYTVFIALYRGEEAKNVDRLLISTLISFEYFRISN